MTSNSSSFDIHVRRPRLGSSAVVCALVALVMAVCFVTTVWARQDESTPTVEAAGTDEEVTTDKATETTAVPDPDESPTEMPELPEEKPAPVDFRQRPYRTVVELSIQNGPRISTLEQDRVRLLVEETIGRSFGRMWDVDVRQSDWLYPCSRNSLSQLSAEEMLIRYPDREFDKVFFVCVESRGNELLVNCREFDTRMQDISPLVDTSVVDITALPVAIVRSLRDAFRPVLTIERKVDDRVHMLIQAGDFPAADPMAEQVVVDDVLRCFQRQMDRRDPEKLNRLMVLPLTYIRVTAVDRGRVVGTLLYPNALTPFGGRGRKLQHMAVRQRPSANKSTVRLVLQPRPDKPLVCHRVDKARQLRWNDERDGEFVNLLSDRNGEIELEVDPGHSTFWLRVYSGTLLLARVPYAPGLIPNDVIKLPDDNVRLRVEGELRLLEDELIDVIGKRAALLGLANRQMQSDDWDGVDATINEIGRIPGLRYFSDKLNQIEQDALRALEEANYSGPERPVKDMCRAFRENIDQFLVPKVANEDDPEWAGSFDAKLQAVKRQATARKMDEPTDL